MKVNLPYMIKINPIFLVFLALFVLIIPFVSWANYAELEQISHATGNVIATTKTQEIQSANDGVIEDILVSEGQHVKKGDLLIRLEKSQYKAAYDSTIAKVAALQAALTRLRAEVYGKPLIFPAIVKEFPEFVSTQTELFHRRQLALNDEISAVNDSLVLAQHELDLNLPLVKSGDVGAAEVIKLKRQIADLKGQMLNKKNKYFQDSQAEMTKAEEELSTKEQELADKSVTLDRSVIVASMDAIVKNIVITTKGAKVKPGDVILELVPSGDELIVEAKLNPADISFVKVGQKAAVKLDAYDYSIYGIFNGKVKYISPDTLVEKTSQGDRYTFRVWISLDTKELMAKNGKIIEIAPGMTTQVDIVTGSRTVLSYLTKPITKTLSESFHER
jgi:multidrug efflux pump subunit AcrA (membrane-fusion protein)